MLAVNLDGNMPYDICEDDVTLDHIETEMARRGVTQGMIDTTRAALERQMLVDLQAIAAKGGDLDWVDKEQNGATPVSITPPHPSYTTPLLPGNHQFIVISPYHHLHRLSPHSHPRTHSTLAYSHLYTLIFFMCACSLLIDQSFESI